MSTAQGFSVDRSERLPLIPEAERTEAQRAAANAIINSPRKAVVGPYIPLLHTPVLMERLGAVGAALRFESKLAEEIRELVMATTARAVDNQLEWQVHAPLAINAGVAPSVLDAIAARKTPRDMPEDQAIAYDLAMEILTTNGVSDATFDAARTCFGADGVVELTVIVGFFTTVSWVMNVARTPGPGVFPALVATPA